MASSGPLPARTAPSARDACSRAMPPPGTTPSAAAARAAFSASFARSLRARSSDSVAPPRRSRAMPAARRARRSCSFSRSKLRYFSASASRRSMAQRRSISCGSPAPSTIVVRSRATCTLFAAPSIAGFRFSSELPRSSVTIWPPVATAMSSSIGLRHWPKPGALTAATRSPPCRLLTISVASASPTTSSATMSSACEDFAKARSAGTIASTLEIVFSCTST